MLLRIFLNLFVEHPIAAIICLLIGGGLIFGLIGGLTDIAFFKTWWFILIGLGIIVLFIWILVELASRGGY